jgi:hypothetical protein
VIDLSSCRFLLLYGGESGDRLTLSEKLLTGL